MGKYQRGILGPFRGLVGPVVGSSWKGIEYMRSHGRKSTKPPSPRQLEQYARFTLLIRFISTMSKLLVTTFQASAIRMTGLNSAFRFNFKNAISGIYPLFTIDYTKVLVSKGQLLNAPAITAIANGAGNLKIDWDDNSGIAMANATDKVVVAVHCPELNQTIYTLEGAERAAKTFTINAGNFTGKTVQTWAAFITEDRDEVSTSIHTGELVIS